MKIVQMLVTLQKGDAIGNFTLALDHALKDEGYMCEIFAYNIGKGIDKGIVKHINQIKKLEPEDLIIYQMCEGHSINDLIKRINCKKIAIYHNITPSIFFARYGRQLYPVQRRAEKVIASMKDQFNLCIAVSPFNRENLTDMGYDPGKIEVNPLIINYADYSQESDYNTWMKYCDEYVNILFVGRVVPNKKQEDVIRAFAYYHNHINSKSRLFLIGSIFTNDYAEAINRYVDYLGIRENVIMPGHSSFPEILAYYKSADIFLCMSEHEGFCVPLVEAMFFDVPIIAYRSTAIPSTLGKSGIIVDTKDPGIISEYIRRLIDDTDYAEDVIFRQRERLKIYEPSMVTDKYIKKIKQVIEEKR